MPSTRNDLKNEGDPCGAAGGTDSGVMMADPKPIKNRLAANIRWFHDALRTTKGILDVEDASEFVIEEALGTLVERERKVRDTLESLFELDEGQAEAADLAAKFDECLIVRASCKQRIANMKVDQKQNNDEKKVLDTSSTSIAGESSSSPKFKLAKFSPPKFSGDLLKWPQFWALYNVAIHTNSSLMPEEKCAHLLTYVEGEALRLVGDLAPTAENYEIAIELLKRRYDQPTARKNQLLKDIKVFKAVEDTEDISKLRGLVDGLISRVRQLEGLNVSAESYSTAIEPELLSKIPVKWQFEWERQNFGKATTFAQFTDFLMKELALVEAVERSRLSLESTSSASGSSSGGHKSSSQPKPYYSSTSALTSSRSWSCPACHRGKHGLSGCRTYQNMNASQRSSIVSKANLCRKCLYPHSIDVCESATCFVCHGPHHTSLHLAENSSSNGRQNDRGRRGNQGSYSPRNTVPRTWSQSTNSNTSRRDASGTSFNISQNGGAVYAMSAVVKVQSPVSGASCLARVLIDTGADDSYIRSSVAKKLCLPIVGNGVFSCIGFQEIRDETKEYSRVECQLFPRMYLPDSKPFTCRLWCADSLCMPLKRRMIPAHESLIGLPLADDFVGGQVDILLGLDLVNRVISDHTMRIGFNLRATYSSFGWILYGKCPSPGFSNSDRHEVRCNKVEQLWDVESLGINVIEEESKAPVKPTWNGERYVVPLMWKGDERPQTNRDMAQKRLNRAVYKMNDDKMQWYDRYMHDKYEEGVIALSTEEELSSSSAFFLPHHTVSKSGSKDRIVFDASAVDGCGRSLNDYLLTGENLLPKLYNVLLRFRTKRIAYQGDIEAAFHTIALNQEDFRYVQFLWQQSVFHFNRLPFGLVCSPYLMNLTVDYHLSLIDSEQAKTLNRGKYVDDMSGTCDDRPTAFEKLKETKEIFKLAGMNIHKERVSGDDVEPSKFLGLIWSAREDQLGIRLPTEVATPTTKREFLSFLNKTFDPLGVLVPWTVTGKLLFQESCSATSSWDDTLSEGLAVKVDRWRQELTVETQVLFPRYVVDDGVEFRVFGDASEKAYCAVVYAVFPNGTTNLLSAKSRLAPLSKSFTIPRLELMAAWIATNLGQTIVSTYDIGQKPRVTFYSDSKDVLYWLQRRRPLKVFVKNRVDQILEKTSLNDWYYIPTELNPADLGTRGKSLKFTIDSSFWWHGPSSHDLPTVPFCEENSTPSELARGEEKRISIEKPVTVVAQEEEIITVFPIESCSKLKHAVYRVGWIKRFISNARKPLAERVLDRRLNNLELTDALEYWIIEAQCRVYRKEIASINAGDRYLQKGSSLQNCRPYLNEDGLLLSCHRTGEEPKIVLPPFSYITTLIIQDAHEISFHQGVTATASILSGKYLIGRAAIRRVVDTCRRCRRYRGKAYSSLEGGMPVYRTEFDRAFGKVGMDYFGPLYRLDGEKYWVLLITCMVTRAIHLEVVRSQNTSDAVLALRRFFALRGTPSVIMSDNARSFRRLQHIVPESVKFTYIPERAPWFGGFWERLVGVTKRAMRITLHNCRLSMEEMTVVLYELSLQLNLRPLTPFNPGSPPLTPAQFLFGVPTVSGVLHPAANPDSSTVKAWRTRVQVSRHLERRWRREYLSTLRNWNSSGRGKPERLPPVGTVVLVHEDKRRSKWPIATVERLLPGPDGKVRVAEIRLRGNITRRPIDKLFYLEDAPEISQNVDDVADRNLVENERVDDVAEDQTFEETEYDDVTDENERNIENESGESINRDENVNQHENVNESVHGTNNDDNVLPNEQRRTRRGRPVNIPKRFLD